jgi:hypothetical protein
MSFIFTPDLDTIMKKLIFVFLFIFTISVLHAQLKIGLKAGYNLSYFDAGYVSNVTYSSKSNFNAGLIFSLPLGSGVTLQPEAFYSGEGANLATTNLTGEYSYQYLNIPVMLKYVAPFHVFLETGPQIGFLLGAHLKEEGFPSTDIKEWTKSAGYSWVFGAGYQLPMGLGLDARYNFGLSDVAKDGTNTYNDGSVKNNVIQIGLFYIFGNPSGNTAPPVKN